MRPLGATTPHRSASPFHRQWWLFVAVWLVLPLLAAGEDPTPPSPSAPPVDPAPLPVGKAGEMPGLEVYDFTSDWDQNAMGQQAGRVLRGKARRLKLFSMLVDMDREGVLQDAPAPADYPDNLEAWVKHARAHFDTRWIAGGRLSHWDPKKKTFVMDLTVVDIGVKNADGTWPAPQTVFAKQFTVEADIFVPPLMDAVLTALTGPHLARGVIVYPEITGRGENLLPNGGFEQLDEKSFALHWEDASMKKGMMATVLRPIDPVAGAKGPAPAPDPANHCMRLSPDDDMATSYGLICYSDLLPVKPNTAYQLQMNIRSQGISVIVWVKGYSMVDGRLRNTYKHQKRFYPDKPGQWNAWSSEAFMPRHPQVPITQMRVMLYTYGGGAGTAWFDDVDLHEVTVKGELPKADFEIPDRATEGWKQADAEDSAQLKTK